MTSRTHSTTHSTTVLERHHNSSAEDDTIRTSIILSRRHLLWPSPPSHYDASDRFALCAPSRQKKSNAKGGRNKDKSGEIELDPTDPADRAFKLAYVYNMPVADAVYVDGPSKHKAYTESALYARIARHKLRESHEVVGSKRKSPSESPALEINNAVAGKSAAIESLPGWIDKAATDDL